MFPYLVINATSLFFHNRRFGTPPTKKDIVNEVKEWTQNVLLPPLKKQRISATGSTGSHSTSSKANPNLKKTAITAIPGTAKSTSCAIVVDSTTEVLKKRPALGTKRRAEDLESTSDCRGRSPHHLEIKSKPPRVTQEPPLNRAIAKWLSDAPPSPRQSPVKDQQPTRISDHVTLGNPHHVT